MSSLCTARHLTAPPTYFLPFFEERAGSEGALLPALLSVGFESGALALSKDSSTLPAPCVA